MLLSVFPTRIANGWCLISFVLLILCLIISIIACFTDSWTHGEVVNNDILVTRAEIGLWRIHYEFPTTEYTTNQPIDLSCSLSTFTIGGSASTRNCSLFNASRFFMLISILSTVLGAFFVLRAIEIYASRSILIGSCFSFATAVFQSLTLIFYYSVGNDFFELRANEGNKVPVTHHYSYYLCVASLCISAVAAAVSTYGYFYGRRKYELLKDLRERLKKVPAEQPGSFSNTWYRADPNARESLRNRKDT
eukprot:Nk52_evm13s1762 gene=Nk52_evmTU13s1762